MNTMTRTEHKKLIGRPAFTPLIIPVLSDPRLPAGRCKHCGTSTHAPAFWNCRITVGNTVCHLCPDSPMWTKKVSPLPESFWNEATQ